MDTDLHIKIKFDNAFNKLFFSRDFIDKMVKRFGKCPAGLTVDTRLTNSIPFFICATKNYGYDNSTKYIPDAAWDDYEINDEKIDPEIIGFMREYIKENDPDLYEEIMDCA